MVNRLILYIDRNKRWYIYTHTHIYIYIYIERERERVGVEEDKEGGINRLLLDIVMWIREGGK